MQLCEQGLYKLNQIVVVRGEFLWDLEAQYYLTYMPLLMHNWLVNII